METLVQSAAQIHLVSKRANNAKPLFDLFRPVTLSVYLIAPMLKIDAGAEYLQVADICVEALVQDAAKNRVFEVVAQESAPYRPLGDLFASVAFRQ